MDKRVCVKTGKEKEMNAPQSLKLAADSGKLFLKAQYMLERYLKLPKLTRKQVLDSALRTLIHTLEENPPDVKLK